MIETIDTGKPITPFMKHGDAVAIEMLDSEGRIAARTAHLGDADPAFVRRVKASLAPLP